MILWSVYHATTKRLALWQTAVLVAMRILTIGIGQGGFIVPLLKRHLGSLRITNASYAGSNTKTIMPLHRHHQNQHVTL